MKKTNKMSTQAIVLSAVMTALVVILQYFAAFLKPGPFSVTWALIPIVIGTATAGKYVGAWLGFVFGVMVLVMGDAAPFMAVNVPGTIITVLLKGTACGFVSGIVYELIYKKSHNLVASVVSAAVVCPIVNTGVFLLGCFAFFMPTVTEWAGGENVGKYIIFVLVGVNFLVEFGINVILSPVIVRLLNIRNKQL